MSARPKAKAARRANDFYETPAGVVRAILPFLSPAPREPAESDDLPWVLDAGCGTGAILREIPRGEWAKFGVEIDPERCNAASTPAVGAWQINGGDYLAGEGHQGPFDLVIGNPPYSLGLEFVVESLNRVRPETGIVAMLLPLTFLAGRARRAWHVENPSDVFVLSPRPSFTGDGKTDATEYAWFVWGGGVARGRLHFLAWEKPSRRASAKGAA